MIYFINTSGVAGILILVLAGLLLVAGILVICLARSRRHVLLFALAASLPLIIGVVGTSAGYARVRAVVASESAPDAAVVEHGRAMARRTTYLGGGVSALLWVVALVGMAAKRDDR